MKPSTSWTGLRVSVFLLLTGLLGTAAAQTLTLNPDRPDVYVVREGDTLWDISGRFLEQPWRWPEVWEVNPEIDNPHLIYPGDRLRLVMEDGEPRIVLEREEDRPVVRLSPQMRELPRDEAIASIPRAVIDNFMVDNLVIGEDRYESAPYVLSSTDERLVLSAGDTVFVRGDWNRAISTWDIIRRGEEYRDPDSDELLGFEVQRLGRASIVGESTPEVRRALIRNSRIEVKAGDRLMARQASAVDVYFFPRPPETAIEGNVISLLGETNMAAQYDSVLLDVGERDGLREGDLLAVHGAPREIEDPVSGETVTVPQEEVATLLVYRSFERLSYGIILGATQPTEIGYRVMNP